MSLIRLQSSSYGASLRWQRKWVVCGLLLCAFWLLVGMSVAGAAHQLGWMFNSNESLFEDQYAMYRAVEINQVEIATRQALLDKNTLPGLRENIQSLLTSPEQSRRRSPLESVRLLVSLSSSNTVDAVLIVPRDKWGRDGVGSAYPHIRMPCSGKNVRLCGTGPVPIATPYTGSK
jgi:hypothetical protein